MSTVRKPEPARVRFTPPREAAFDFRLKDQNGTATSLKDARGNVVVMTFIYSSCRDLCPAEGNVISDAIERVGDQGVRTYVVSVDPIGDTPARVKEWLTRRDLPGDSSHYLLGTRRQLRPVWQAYGIVPLVATDAEAKAAMAGSSAFWKQNPYRPGSPNARTRRRRPATRPPRRRRTTRTPATSSTAAASAIPPAGTSSTPPTCC